MSRAAVIALIGLAALAGCSSPGPSPGPKHTAASEPATATPPATVAATSTSPVSTPPSPPPASAPASPPAGGVPALGQLAGDFAHGAGFGQVKPSRIFNGGDPTGLVTGVAWTSWGGAKATATGTAEYVAPNQSVAQGTEETVTVVAFNLGTCDGKYMYRALEWFFPQHHQAFDPDAYQDVCTGSYVPAP